MRHDKIIRNRICPRWLQVPPEPLPALRLKLHYQLSAHHSQ